MSRKPVLELSPEGLFCPAGDFHIDPWARVPRAVITHAHSDHARWGMDQYLCERSGIGVLRHRVGPGASITGLTYGESVTLAGAKVSLHPAGHILGSSQVRIEVDGEVWVVSGDYKTEPDPTVVSFEPVRCHGFVTESTFGLPIYQWQPASHIFAQVHAWWAANQQQGRTSVLLGYALGKLQRILASLESRQGPIICHGATTPMNLAYRLAGVPLPRTLTVSEVGERFRWSDALVLAPPSAAGTPWMRRFGATSLAYASGWMAIRGIRRRRAVDRGFVLSDHVDWPSLLSTVRATEAAEVWVTHGYTAQVVRHLTEMGLRARALPTRFTGEDLDATEDTPSEPEASE